MLVDIQHAHTPDASCKFPHQRDLDGNVFNPPSLWLPLDAGLSCLNFEGALEHLDGLGTRLRRLRSLVRVERFIAIGIGHWPPSLRRAATCRCIVSGTLLPPCNARFEPQDANRLWHIGSHIWSTIEMTLRSPGSSRYPFRGGAPASLERRDQGTDRRGINAPGAVVSEVARRHDMSPQHLFGWRKAARAGLLTLPADEVPMFVPIVREARDDGVAAAAGVTVSGVITIEIAGAVVRAERGVDLGWLRDVLRAVKAAT